MKIEIVCTYVGNMCMHVLDLVVSLYFCMLVRTEYQEVHSHYETRHNSSDGVVMWGRVQSNTICIQDSVIII